MAYDGGGNLTRLVRPPAFWTPEKLEQLAALWVGCPELSTAKIGAELGCSKSAVISKAHYINLPPRRAPEPPPPPRRDLYDLPRGACRWPIGHPSDEDFHFCGEVADAGHSYCAGHRARATLKPRSKQEAPGHVDH